MVMTMIARPCRRVRDDAQPEVDERPGVGVGPDEDLEVMRLVLLGDADLEEAIERRPVLAAARRRLDERLDVGEAQDRGQAGPRDAPVRALALPVRQADGLEPRDRRGRRGCVQPMQGERVDRLGGPDPGSAAPRPSMASGRRLPAGRDRIRSSP